ncbi:uncharacterized protein J3D65DRAFT_639887 [Phyllosticta citribraziliensis]|uniref:Secreted peptide n=1 Tax=Phyllosticta citribraziliensis TaxID=989973 RepID=A0ABR1L8B2_9PEZI
MGGVEALDVFVRLVLVLLLWVEILVSLLWAGTVTVRGEVLRAVLRLGSAFVVVVRVVVPPVKCLSRARRCRCS